MGQTADFGDLPEEYSVLENARVVVIPVPFDHTSTWLKGADKGPAAIIEASAHMELYDIETDSEVYKRGIFTAQPVDGQELPEDMVEMVAEQVRQYRRDNKFVVVLGGEHSVSLGSVREHAANNAGLTVLQLDAHSDLRDEYEGSKYNHACAMARIMELCPIVQVGIRSMDSSEKKALDTSRVIFAREIFTNKNWIEKVLSKLSENVYVTIDLDVFDPSIMPSTGTPEPGGLLWYDVLGLMRTVIESRNVVGFDIVELCPEERNKAPDFLAAKLIYKLLSYKFRG
ncbi:MAG: agmatinase [Planctomycetes bacterium RBG_13_50_24]|nr:MAG: agmatinase [Planctomycetes bacterium RBG_13_50_24]